MTMIDLRSDILVRPTAAMIEAIAAAASQPRSYGIRDCPDMRRLEARAAELLGKEDALFFPSCTMANQAALMLFCGRGEAVLAESDTHIAGTEQSATAATAGVTVRMMPGEHGHLPPAEVREVLADPPSAPMRATRLLWMENTHNNAGGTVQPEAWRREIVELCAQHGMAVHMDGARLWNAAIALGLPPSRLVEGVTTVAASLSKALGAPLGAVLAGDTRTIRDAVEIRQMLGGTQRRAGLIAGAGLIALDHMRDRIAEDHAHARRVAEAIHAQDHGLRVDLATVQTNIVNVRTDDGIAPRELVAALAKAGVMSAVHGAGNVRLVFHAEVDEIAVERTIAAFDHVGAAFRAGGRERAKADLAAALRED